MVLKKFTSIKAYLQGSFKVTKKLLSTTGGNLESAYILFHISVEISKQPAFTTESDLAVHAFKEEFRDLALDPDISIINIHIFNFIPNPFDYKEIGLKSDELTKEFFRIEESFGDCFETDPQVGTSYYIALEAYSSTYDLARLREKVKFSCKNDGFSYFFTSYEQYAEYLHFYRTSVFHRNLINLFSKNTSRFLVVISTRKYYNLLIPQLQGTNDVVEILEKKGLCILRKCSFHLDDEVYFDPAKKDLDFQIVKLLVDSVV